MAISMESLINRINASGYLKDIRFNAKTDFSKAVPSSDVEDYFSIPEGLALLLMKLAPDSDKVWSDILTFQDLLDIIPE